MMGRSTSSQVRTVDVTGTELGCEAVALRVEDEERMVADALEMIRHPWDPRAVSHPWLLEEQFGRRRTPTPSGAYQHGHAAHETPAETTRTGPLEFKDNASTSMSCRTTTSRQIPVTIQATRTPTAPGWILLS
jgi:hypothetical protein